MTEFVSRADTTPTLEDDILITIQPRHAERIYSGAKTYELRKTIPRRVPRRIFLYETRPRCAVTGHAIVGEVLSGSPDYIWLRTGTLGTSRTNFDKYFSGSSMAHAYRIEAAVRYDQALTLGDIAAVAPGFRVPQNFLYVQNLASLAQTLRAVALRESVATASPPVSLVPISASTTKAFRELVSRHITGSYLETGDAYARKIVEIAAQGDDPEGFLTASKMICEVRHFEVLVGFVVFTFKHGGSVKTGPVVFFEKYQNRGYGKLLRVAVHAVMSRLGYRKVYATVPCSNARAAQYLLSSDYKIEAHLTRHYHTDHDELVFGHLLTNTRGPGPEFIREIIPASDFWQLTEPDSVVSAFISEEFSKSYCSVSGEWAARQVNLSCGAQSSFKPRIIFVAASDFVVAVAICLLKRGGSTKIVLLSRTAHQPTVTAFVRHVIDSLRSINRNSVRKVYSMVPIADTDLIQALIDAGFGSEGVLREPFNANSDNLVLGRVLDD